MKNIILIVSLLILGLASSSSYASGFYFSTKGSSLIALDESNADTTLGAGLGYRWAKLFALEFGYQRIFSTVDNNLLELSAVVTGYRSEWLWPYALLAGGVAISTASNSDPEAQFRLGGGTMIRLNDYIRPFIELSYLNIGVDAHFIQPMVGVTFGF